VPLAAAEQLRRVGHVNVLGEHEHRHLRVRVADLLGGLQPLVGVGRRHANVDHGDLRLLERYLA
jgi:hypothetical protein